MVNQAEFAALLDELKKINPRLDKSEEVTATLQQELHNRDFTPHTRNHTVEEIKLADLPTFEGDRDPETYLDWERRLDRLFRYKNLDNTKRFNYAILKLTNLCFKVELQPLTTFDDVFSLAMKLEKQNKGKSSVFGQFSAPKAEHTAAPAAHETEQQTAPKDDTMAALKSKLEKAPLSQQPTRKIVCFRCQDEGHALVLRRSLISAPEDGFDTQRCNLFHSNCLVKDKVCSFIIDSGSCTNVCALNLAESLQLPMRKQPHAYKLNWLNDDGGVWVRKQALVSFKVGSYTNEMWFDAIPMTACALLLGRPWQTDRHVIHNGKTNEYSVLMGSCRDEVLDTTTTKKDRRYQVLQLRKGTTLDVGDRVWLSLTAQRLHVNHKDGEPMDEGPFQIIDKVRCWVLVFRVVSGWGIQVLGGFGGVAGGEGGYGRRVVSGLRLEPGGESRKKLGSYLIMTQF
uniref:Gag-pol polyprotein n=1 Tax=Chenopodium quinoa TaxID=63459 RepID=A0A803MAX1_CHEQI